MRCTLRRLRPINLRRKRAFPPCRCGSQTGSIRPFAPEPTLGETGRGRLATGVPPGYLGTIAGSGGDADGAHLSAHLRRLQLSIRQEPRRRRRRRPRIQLEQTESLRRRFRHRLGGVAAWPRGLRFLEHALFYATAGWAGTQGLCGRAGIRARRKTFQLLRTIGAGLDYAFWPACSAA